MNSDQLQLIAGAKKILLIQAENPDGDSLGSVLALAEILADLGKQTQLFCAVQMPKYLRYIAGWDLVGAEFDPGCDLAVMVDNSSRALIDKSLALPGFQHFLETRPVLVLDHHGAVEPDLPFGCERILGEKAVSTGELIFDLAKANHWKINPRAAADLFISIQSDSLGLTVPATTAHSFEVCGELVELGAVPSDIDRRRREFMKKSPEILAYKGRLIDRIEYLLDGRVALIHIPWEEISKYSDQYNPTMLVIDEMRMVSGVDVAIGIKTYPDQKLTGKVRVNIPVADQVAGFFGGGGHKWAAGFKIYEDYDKWLREFTPAMQKIFDQYDKENSATDAENFTESNFEKSGATAQPDGKNHIRFTHKSTKNSGTDEASSDADTFKNPDADEAA
ncbi:MAG: DHH family phosphoesterase [Candidatus Nomurabacteria bacterium]|nr:DHH family phosphoesterase [Candidatus Nomurabacteria bacterium]